MTYLLPNRVKGSRKKTYDFQPLAERMKMVNCRTWPVNVCGKHMLSVSKSQLFSVATVM